MSKSTQAPKRKRRPQLRAAYWETLYADAWTDAERLTVALRWLQSETRNARGVLPAGEITTRVLVTARDINRQQQEKSGSPSRAYTPLRT